MAGWPVLSKVQLPAALLFTDLKRRDVIKLTPYSLAAPVLPVQYQSRGATFLGVSKFVQVAVVLPATRSRQPILKSFSLSSSAFLQTHKSVLIGRLRKRRKTLLPLERNYCTLSVLGFCRTNKRASKILRLLILCSFGIPLYINPRASACATTLLVE